MPLKGVFDFIVSFAVIIRSVAKVAEAGEGLSLPQYSSIDGKVVFVDENIILIEK